MNGKRLKRNEDDGVRGTDFIVVPFLEEQIPGIGTWVEVRAALFLIDDNMM